jgi:hypothetical protein
VNKKAIQTKKKKKTASRTHKWAANKEKFLRRNRLEEKNAEIA